MSNIFIGVGSDQQGQLGIEKSSSNQLGPRILEVFKPPLNDFKDIICGELHTLFLTRDGIVYAGRYFDCAYIKAGSNKKGQVGQLLSTFYAYGLTRVPFDKKIVKISANANLCVFLAEDGTVYLCGDNTELLEEWGPIIGVPVQVGTYFKNKKFIDVCASVWHFVVQQDNYDIWLWGDLDEDAHSQEPINVCWDNKHLNERLYKMSGGKYHHMFITESRRLLGVGISHLGQMGIGGSNKEEKENWRCVEIDFFSKRGLVPEDVASGSTHTLVLTKDGSCYGCGFRSALPIFTERLGTKKTAGNIMEFAKIPLYNVTAISANMHNCFFVVNDSEVWVCGQFLTNMLPKKSFKRKEVKPIVQIDYADSVMRMQSRMIKFADYKITKIRAGRYHCIIEMGLRGKLLQVEMLHRMSRNEIFTDVAVIVTSIY